MIRVSVIIPVYNAAPFLHSCVQSLLNQTEKSLEFIFVNDGSTDESLSILESYTDPRIILLNQTNAGVSAARNAGLAVARGTYVGFVDADDFVETTMFQHLADLAVQHQAEIVVSRFSKSIDGQTVVYDLPFRVHETYDKKAIAAEVIPYMLQFDRLNSVAVKLFDRSLLVRHAIQFPVGQALGEDGLFSLLAFDRCERAVFTDYVGYHYREVPGSATRNIVNKNYYQAALDVYRFDHSQLLTSCKWSTELDERKRYRLYAQALALLSVYARPATGFTLGQRYRAFKSVATDKNLQQTVRNSSWRQLGNESWFKRFVLLCIYIKCLPALWLAFTYSNLRNKVS